MPLELKEQFLLLNGTNAKYDDDYFMLNSFSEFENILGLYSQWNGIPNFKSFLALTKETENHFLIGNYLNHTFNYHVKFDNQKSTSKCEVLVVCGDNFKMVADNFFEFLRIYRTESNRLLL